MGENIMGDFKIADGVLEEYTGPGGEVVIPEGVTEIGDWTFSNCESLTSIQIPATVTYIAESAFTGCKNLSVIIAPTIPPEFWISCEMYIPTSLESGNWSMYQLMIPAVMGYLTNSDLYQDPEIIAEYKKYISAKSYKIRQLLFRNDFAQGIAVLAEWKIITAKNFEADFLQPAMEANAVACVAYLLDWTKRNIHS